VKRESIVGLALISMILVLSVATFSTRVTATDFSKVGVKSGDWANYLYTMANASTEYTIRETVNFTNVAGNTVTLNWTVYNINGTKRGSQVFVGNVSTTLATFYVQGFGNMTAPVMFEYIIPANLSAHDPIYSGAPYTINETVPMVVANLSRQVNHLNVTQIAPEYQTLLNMSINIYWDRETGITVAEDLYSPTTSMRNNMTLTSTSLWHQTSGLTLQQVLLIGGGVIAIAVVVSAVLVIQRHRRKLSPQIIPEPAQLQNA
jgi:hypothetical protein